MYNMSSPFFNAAAGREQALKSIIEQATRELGMLQNQQYTTGIPGTISTQQNFQMTPVQVGLPFKLVNSIEEVKNEIVLSDTYFLSENYNRLWIKNAAGKIRTFDVLEQVFKDEKDLKIEELQNEIKELKRGMNNVNGKYDGANGNTKDAYESSTSKSSNVQSNSSSISKRR